MTFHHEKRIVPYTPDQLFELVADVRKYPEFLPWCVSTNIYNKTNDTFFLTWRLVLNL